RRIVGRVGRFPRAGRTGRAAEFERGLAGAVERDDAVIPGVGDIDRAVGTDGDAGRPEAVFRLGEGEAALGVPGPEVGAGGVEAFEPGVALIDDVDRAVGRRGDA